MNLLTSMQHDMENLKYRRLTYDQLFHRLLRNFLENHS